MAINTYDLGDSRRHEIAFYDKDDVLTDPTTVTFSVKEPDGTLTVYTYGVDSELLKKGTGGYYIEIEYDQVGIHVVKWSGVGIIDVTETQTIYIKHNEAV